MRILRLIKNASRQSNNLCENQLRDRPSITKRGIEDGDTGRFRGRQVDLVGANAEAADGEEAVRGLEDAGRYLGLRADAEQMDVGYAVDEVMFG